MRIIYMGTPDFAVPPLKALADGGQQVVLVVSQPDKARDRGKQLAATPVKAAALELGLPVAQPAAIRNNEEFLAQVKALEPDLMVVAAYGKILPPALLAVPRLGCINIHGSLLPKYRGAAPIQQAILQGDAETGVTLMHMAAEMDAGDMIAKKSTSTAGKTAGDLHEELSLLGAALLMEQLPALEAGTAPREPQDESLVTLAPMISKADGEMDFTASAFSLECRIRAFQPWPGAYTYLDGALLKLLAADVLDENSGREPGTVLSADGSGIRIACGTGVLSVTRLQLAGKKAMDAGDFLRGRKIDPGTKLG